MPLTLRCYEPWIIEILLSPRELLSLTVMVVLMPWLSDKSMEFKCIGLRGKQPWCKPREAFKEAFSVTF
ncbi:TPA: hypothetical protein MIK29_24595 [Klebsiella pneumoniae]|nr:hypothetical protein [Klebsiella pneumoniae]